jgi:5-formyltetrahydrofolate cyclo-ligase
VDKDNLRKLLLSKITSLSDSEIQSLSFRLTHQLIKFFSSRPELSNQVGGAFLPLKSELAPVYQELLHAIPLDLSFPVLVNGQMSFGIPNGMPKGGVWLDLPYHLVEPDWLLVPGLGFDLSGARLGRGKGYFDRYFFDQKQNEKDILSVGLAWSEQVIEKIPMEQHDCYLDFIITEDYCWDVNQQVKF